MTHTHLAIRSLQLPPRLVPDCVMIDLDDMGCCCLLSPSSSPARKAEPDCHRAAFMTGMGFTALTGPAAR
jgi:hypothetical protein